MRRRKLIRLWIAVMLLASLSVSCALGEPLRLIEDLTYTFSLPYDENDASAGSFVFSFRYPCADESDPTAYRVNRFYEALADDLISNMIPIQSEMWAEDGTSVKMSTDYIVQCNNDEFFSVLIVRQEEIAGESGVFWEGNTFSRLHGVSDSTYDLPRLLGILDASERDAFLENRQTEKANNAVWILLMDRIRENPAYRQLSEEELRYACSPDQDFYLNDQGDPVFYVQPGYLSDASDGYITFTLTLDEIMDEM